MQTDFPYLDSDEQLPDWAREQLEKLRSGQEIGPVTPDQTQEMM